MHNFNRFSFICQQDLTQSENSTVKPELHQTPKLRVPNRFFGIRDLAYFKAGIRDFEEKGGRDSGL